MKDSDQKVPIEGQANFTREEYVAAQVWLSKVESAWRMVLQDILSAQCKKIQRLEEENEIFRDALIDIAHGGSVNQRHSAREALWKGKNE